MTAIDIELAAVVLEATGKVKGGGKTPSQAAWQACQEWEGNINPTGWCANVFEWTVRVLRKTGWFDD
jgi:hypothetical protein